MYSLQSRIVFGSDKDGLREKAFSRHCNVITTNSVRTLSQRHCIRLTGQASCNLSIVDAESLIWQSRPKGLDSGSKTTLAQRPNPSGRDSPKGSSKQQAVHSSSSTASSGQTYKRPSFMVEQAPFKGPSKSAQGTSHLDQNPSARDPSPRKPSSKESAGESKEASRERGVGFGKKGLTDASPGSFVRGSHMAGDSVEGGGGSKQREEGGLGVRSLLKAFQPRSQRSQKGDNAPGGFFFLTIKQILTPSWNQDALTIQLCCLCCTCKGC